MRDKINLKKKINLTLHLSIQPFNYCNVIYVKITDIF